MRLLILGIILGFAAGLLVGDRYGAPGLLRDAARPLLGDPGPEPPSAETSAAPDQAAGGESGSTDPGLSINEAGLAIIRESEGLRLAAYWGGSQWLIGYGHSRTAREGMTITEAEAEALLRADVADSEDAVRRAVTVSVNRNQFSAMVSLAYNLGAGGFGRSKVVERVNAGDYAGAADAFLFHDRGRVDGEMQVIPHLTERRKKERALFLS